MSRDPLDFDLDPEEERIAEEYFVILNEILEDESTAPMLKAGQIHIVTSEFLSAIFRMSLVEFHIQTTLSQALADQLKSGNIPMSLLESLPEALRNVLPPEVLEKAMEKENAATYDIANSLREALKDIPSAGN